MKSDPLNHLNSLDVQVIGSNIQLRTPTRQDAKHLSNLICTDHILRSAAGMQRKPTASAYLTEINLCKTEKQTLVFAIVDVNDLAIGQISLSQIDVDLLQCRMGYWLGSAHWNQGKTTAAVGLNLALAQHLGIQKTHSTVVKSNVPSWRILQRYDAIRTDKDNEKYLCTIDLSQNRSFNNNPIINIRF